MDDSSWVPEGIDRDTASVARVYDYLLGGTHNFAADRLAARGLVEMQPAVQRFARENRSFVRRAVRYLCGLGIGQFLDLGSGIPTVGNVHEVAFALNPDARVVYVDHDEVAVRHGRLLLHDEPRGAIIASDLTRPTTVFADAEASRLLDLDRPTGVILAAVLHFIPDYDEATALLHRYATLMAPGSHLVLSHGSDDGFSKADSPEVLAKYRSETRVAVRLRSREEVQRLVEPVLDPVEPGVVQAALWRPELGAEDDPVPASRFGAEPPELSGGYAVVGRIR